MIASDRYRCILSHSQRTSSHTVNLQVNCMNPQSSVHLHTGVLDFWFRFVEVDLTELYLFTWQNLNIYTSLLRIISTVGLVAICLHLANYTRLPTDRPTTFPGQSHRNFDGLFSNERGLCCVACEIDHELYFKAKPTTYADRPPPKKNSTIVVKFA